jgi:sulfite exporter TauE/SafE
MIDWLLIFTGGLLGSSHCLGMCGGFVLTLGTARTRFRNNLFRQMVYSLGRVFTYSCAGAVAGYAGWRLTVELRTILRAQAVLSITAGLLLVLQGLAALGIVHVGLSFAGKRPCLGPSFFAALLGATRAYNVFLGGMVNGLLPCGLVYAYLALAASSGGWLWGWAVMAAFGLGTVPAMVLAGCGGSLLSATCRRRLMTVAAWCVVVTGSITILRGCGFLQAGDLLGTSACPGCFVGVGD